MAELIIWFCSGMRPFIFFIVFPYTAGIISVLLRKRKLPFEVFNCIYAAFQLIPATCAFVHGFEAIVLPLAGQGIELRLAADPYSRVFILLNGIVFSMILPYCSGYSIRHGYPGRFMILLYISKAMLNSALISDNLAGMLFCWEGLLITLFLIQLINNIDNPHAAFKSVIVCGTADLLMMAGIVITAHTAGTLTISGMHDLSMSGIGRLGFWFMFLGAVGKAGCMPFHSWIPDAASDGPLPFLVAFPGSVEKLLGIYLAGRLVTQIYDVKPGGPDSIAMMTLGTVSILFSVAMALIQKDMKRLLAYHAVSQVGYMVLGIGTCLPIGIVGGLYHMINNAIYKSALFMTAGNVENRVGTTDARKVSGLKRLMPVTYVCYIFAALAISGVPPFNGFFSKELIFDAALESCPVFYIGALLGAVMTAISFLKVGHAVFGGELKLPEGVSKEGPGAPAILRVPEIFFALLCLLSGLFNQIPVDDLFGWSLGYTDKFAGWPKSAVLVAISIIALLTALLDHIYGWKKTGVPINAADHIHEAPGLKQIYALAVKGYFDPYNWLINAVKAFRVPCVAIDHAVKWFYDVFLVRCTKGLGNLLSRMDNGHLSRYIDAAVLGMVGLAVIIIVFLF